MSSAAMRAARDAAFSLTTAEAPGIAHVRLMRPPHNFLDAFVLRDLCDALELLDRRGETRCLVLSAEGRNFSAGRDFGGTRAPGDTSEAVYAEAVRLMNLSLPIVTAVQGAAVGAGLGLALIADVRLCSERAYFAANFVVHGLHHGFGTSVTLPRAVEPERATELVMSGRKVGAAEALAIGLVGEVVAEDMLLKRAFAAARRFADHPPQAVRAIRRTMRGRLARDFTAAVRAELAEQQVLKGGGDQTAAPERT